MAKLKMNAHKLGGLDQQKLMETQKNFKDIPPNSGHVFLGEQKIVIGTAHRTKKKTNKQ